MSEFVCQSCGQRASATAGDAPKFCSRCGGALAAVPARDDDDILELADEVAPAIAAPADTDVKIPPVIVPPVLSTPPQLPELPTAPIPLEVSPRPVPKTAEAVTEMSPPAPADDGLDLKPAAGPAAPVFEEPMILDAIRCPNCGNDIPAGAEICTDCGYSRRLGRTLSTRVGNPEIPRVHPTIEVPPTSETEAEKVYARQRKRRAVRITADTVRLGTALFFLLILTTIAVAIPFGSMQNLPFILPGRLATLAEGQHAHAILILALLVVIVAPILAVGVRIGASLSGIDVAEHMMLLRAAGTVAVLVLTADVVFTSNEVLFKLEPRFFYTLLACETAVGLLIFTWYLHGVRLSAALALWIYSVLFIALGVAIACAAYHPLARLIHVQEPFLPPVGEWFSGASLPG